MDIDKLTPPPPPPKKKKKKKKKTQKQRQMNGYINLSSAGTGKFQVI